MRAASCDDVDLDPIYMALSIRFPMASNIRVWCTEAASGGRRLRVVHAQERALVNACRIHTRVMFALEDDGLQAALQLSSAPFVQDLFWTAALLEVLEVGTATVDKLPYDAPSPPLLSTLPQLLIPLIRCARS